MRIVFSKRSAGDVAKLDSAARKRIKAKLEWFLAQENPISFARPPSDPSLGQYRFRIGDYRVIFDLLDDEILVLRVGHRKDIYND